MLCASHTKWRPQGDSVKRAAVLDLNCKDFQAPWGTHNPGTRKTLRQEISSSKPTWTKYSEGECIQKVGTTQEGTRFKHLERKARSQGPGTEQGRPEQSGPGRPHAMHTGDPPSQS